LGIASAVVFLVILNAVITCVFSAMGRPALHRRAVATSAAVMLISIYPACKLFGVAGGQVAALAAIVSSYLLQIARIRGLTGLDLAKYRKAFERAGLVSAGLLCCGLGIHFFGLTIGPVAQIAVGICACLLAYCLSVPALLKVKHSNASDSHSFGLRPSERI